MPNDRAIDAQLGEHRRRYLAGEGAGILEVHVLRGHPDRGIAEALDDRHDGGEWRADEDLDALHFASHQRRGRLGEGRPPPPRPLRLALCPAERWAPGDRTSATTCLPPPCGPAVARPP